MTSASGPPLHSRFNEAEAVAAVSRRYVALREMVSAQVAALQGCSEFQLQCARYYERGIPDWVIVNSIASRLLFIRVTEGGKRAPRSGEVEEVFRAGGSILAGVLPCSEFLGEVFERQLGVDQMAMLKGYGFVPRRRYVGLGVIERFLRERMRHFDFDLPHAALFGRPPGSWPTIPGS